VGFLEPHGRRGRADGFARLSGKRIIIHSLADAQAALAAAEALAVPVTLVSAEGAGGYVGALWFKAVIETATAKHPTFAATAVLDCAGEAGTVLNALRHGIKRVRFAGSAAALKRLKEIARACGAEIESGRRPAALDLLRERDAAAACRRYLTAPARRR